MVMKAALHELQSALLGRGGPSLVPTSPGAVRERSRLRLDSLPAYHEALVARIAPMCEILYLTMVVDGSEGAREYRVLRGAVRLLTDGEVPSGVLDELLQRFRSDSDDISSRLAMAGARLAGNREDAEAALILSVALASADGPLTSAEQSFLTEVADVLGISHKHRQQLLQEALDPDY